jgi:hypothetical protein
LPYTGTIVLEQNFLNGKFVNGSAAADFSTTSTATAGCTTKTSGACTLTKCPNIPDPVLASAGTVTLSGGKLPGPTSLAPMVTFQSAFFSAGDTFRVSASGGKVGAFSGTSGPAPADITVTAPPGTVIDPDGTIVPNVVDESKDLKVTWTGASTGSTVEVSLSNPGGTFAILAVTCSFDGPGGAGTVPSALLTQLGPVPAHDFSSDFSVTPKTTSVLVDNNASVSFDIRGTTNTLGFNTP